MSGFNSHSPNFSRDKGIYSPYRIGDEYSPYYDGGDIPSFQKGEILEKAREAIIDGVKYLVRKTTEGIIATPQVAGKISEKTREKLSNIFSPVEGGKADLPLTHKNAGY